MKVKISKWGNSLGLRLPKMAIETLGLKNNDTVDIGLEGNKLIIKPSKLTLEKIFENYSGESYDNYDWGEIDKPSGKELL